MSADRCLPIFSLTVCTWKPQLDSILYVLCNGFYLASMMYCSLIKLQDWSLHALNCCWGILFVTEVISAEGKLQLH
jgi:hypothetical protein